MTKLVIPRKTTATIDFLALGALVQRMDSGILPASHADQFQVYCSGGEFNPAAVLANYGFRTKIVTAMVNDPRGAWIEAKVREMGVEAHYVRMESNGVNGPNIATVYSDRGFGSRAPVVTYNRANEAGALLKPGDVDWPKVLKGVRWLHSGGIFAALSATTGPLIIEAMEVAKNLGSVVSFDLNVREKLWAIQGGLETAQACYRKILPLVDVVFGNEEDFQLGLGLAGPEVRSSTSKLDPTPFLALLENVREIYPNFKVIATSLREVLSASRHRWGAVMWYDGRAYVTPRFMELDIHDRVGGGDALAAGLIAAMLKKVGPQQAIELAQASGALATTYPGDVSLASCNMVESLAKGGGARIQR